MTLGEYDAHGYADTRNALQANAAASGATLQQQHVKLWCHEVRAK